MPESVNGRFKLHSPCEDDSSSLFNQVIYLGKLIWAFCMLFLWELSKQEALLRLKTSSGTCLCLCQNVKTVRTKGIKVQQFSPRSTVCTQNIVEMSFSENMRTVNQKWNVSSGISSKAKTVALQMPWQPVQLWPWRRHSRVAVWLEVECYVLNASYCVATAGLYNSLHFTFLHFQLRSYIFWCILQYGLLGEIKPYSDKTKKLHPC